MGQSWCSDYEWVKLAIAIIPGNAKPTLIIGGCCPTLMSSGTEYQYLLGGVLFVGPRPSRPLLRVLRLLSYFLSDSNLIDVLYSNVPNVTVLPSALMSVPEMGKSRCRASGSFTPHFCPVNP